MTEGTARLVTGATGFVGGAITLELVRMTSDPIVCLVRPGRDGASPATRLAESLTHACKEYGELDLIDQALEQCKAITADLTDPQCGVDPAALPAVSEVWHAAASLAFEQEREEAIAAANVGGTEQIMLLARSLGATSFNHVSTAYVGGAREGKRAEDLPPKDAPCNNAYERTKLVAEHLVYSADFSQVRIFRPSIVVGHSQTHAATAFTGVYGFVRSLLELRERVSAVLGDMLAHRSLRLLGDASAPINVIPIDMVASSAVRIALSESTERIFHLTNSEPPQLEMALEVISGLLGIKPPRYVMSPDELTSIDVKVDEHLQFYRSYIGKTLEFNQSNAESVLGSESVAFPVSPDLIERFITWYLQHLEAEREPESSSEVVA